MGERENVSRKWNNWGTPRTRFRRRLNGIDIDIVMPNGTIEETVGVFPRITQGQWTG